MGLGGIDTLMVFDDTYHVTDGGCGVGELCGGDVYSLDNIGQTNITSITTVGSGTINQSANVSMYVYMSDAKYSIRTLT